MVDLTSILAFCLYGRQGRRSPFPHDLFAFSLSLARQTDRYLAGQKSICKRQSIRGDVGAVPHGPDQCLTRLLLF
jgi:hypothetical protein